MQPQNTPNSQSNPEKERQSCRYLNSELQAILKSIVIKTVWYRHKNTQTNGTEEEIQKWTHNYVVN